MGFFQKLVAKQMSAWQNTMTEEDIDKLEQQGCDVTELRKQLAANIAAKEEKKQNMLDALDFGKLEPYKSGFTPDFVDAVAKINGLNKKRALALLNEGAPLVYGRVVQANSALYEEGAKDGTYYAVVFLFALDDAHRYDIEWLDKTAKTIQYLKDESNKDIAPDNRDFFKTLRDDRSQFCFKLGESLAGSADAWCATFTFEKPSALPFGQIPANRIIPILVKEQPVFNRMADIDIIPAAYYTK